jgi:hypothetical protein
MWIWQRAFEFKESTAVRLGRGVSEGSPNLRLDIKPCQAKNKDGDFDMRSLPEVIGLFQQVVKEANDKSLTREGAIQKLKELYESNLIDIKTELKDHFEIFAFHNYLGGTKSIEQYIDICNRLENSQSELERNNYETLIQQIINGVAADCRKYGRDEEADFTAILTVRDEIEKILALCCENRKVKELYEKYKDEIEVLFLKNGNEILPQQEIPQLGNPDWVQKQIDHTIALLLAEKYIKKHKIKGDDFEYRPAKSVSKIIETLKAKKQLRFIVLPEVEDIEEFLITHVRSPKGNSLYDAIKEMHKRENKKETQQSKNSKQNRIKQN